MANQPHLDIHDTVDLTLKGIKVPVDVKIADMVLKLNHYPSVETTGSCQGGCGSTCREEAWISFHSNPEDLTAIMLQFGLFASFQWSGDNFMMLIKTADLDWMNSEWFPNSPYLGDSGVRSKPTIKPPRFGRRVTAMAVWALIGYAVVSMAWLPVSIALWASGMVSR